MAALAASEPPTITQLEERLTFLLQQPRDDQFIRALGDITKELRNIYNKNTDPKILTHAKRLLDEIDLLGKANDAYLFGEPTESSKDATGASMTPLNRGVLPKPPGPPNEIQKLQSEAYLQAYSTSQVNAALRNENYNVGMARARLNKEVPENLGQSFFGGKRKRKTRKRMTRKRKHKKSKTRKFI